MMTKARPTIPSQVQSSAATEGGDKTQGGNDETKEPRRQSFYAKIAPKKLQMRRHEALVFLGAIFA
jgi:hypothetical protein